MEWSSEVTTLDVLLSILDVFETLVVPDVQTPCLGTPLVPLWRQGSRHARLSRRRGRDGPVASRAAREDFGRTRCCTCGCFYLSKPPILRQKKVATMLFEAPRAVLRVVVIFVVVILVGPNFVGGNENTCWPVVSLNRTRPGWQVWMRRIWENLICWPRPRRV